MPNARRRTSTMDSIINTIIIIIIPALPPTSRAPPHNFYCRSRFNVQPVHRPCAGLWSRTCRWARVHLICTTHWRDFGFLYTTPSLPTVMQTSLGVCGWYYLVQKCTYFCIRMTYGVEHLYIIVNITRTRITRNIKLNKHQSVNEVVRVDVNSKLDC